MRRTPGLAIPLAMMALVGTLGFNFQVILPLLARFTFDGGAAAYTALAVAMGIGSVAGALATGARERIGPGLLTGSALLFGAAALVAAAAPTLAAEALLLVPLGAASVTFAAGINSTLQLAAAPADAGARDGALLDRLPRIDSDRRPADRLARRDRGPAHGPAARRRRRADGRARLADRLRAGSP